MSSTADGVQASLFPDTGVSVIYEQPLNERIRNCLRLEHLFVSIESGIAEGSPERARDTITSMLDVCDFLLRTDIKGELIKELERNSAQFSALRSNPSVSQDALDRTLSDIGDVLGELKKPDYQPGSALRADELVAQIKQRINIPGGTCSFDVPAFHHWLNSNTHHRAETLKAWMKDLRVVERATRTILALIRDSSHPRVVTATAGVYQEQFDSNVQHQLVRVILPRDIAAFPEISGGKHRFTIRFCRQDKTSSRPVQIEEDVNFELRCCGI
ncbi:MAG: cell division protein ZapD [Gammaproteobacteria bacterium]